MRSKRHIVHGDPIGNRIREGEQYLKYRIRVCRYLNRCSLCLGDITSGQSYHDGGYSRRAHTECVRNWMAPDAS
jgi:hypothetical protein